PSDRFRHANDEVLTMHSRAFAAATLMASLLAASSANAQFWRSDDGLFGRPAERYVGNASPIQRTLVSYPVSYRPGTIVINTSERRLYLITGSGQALRYGIGVGRDGFTWAGVKRITAKKEWPSWTPPAQMRRRRPDLPSHMAGGIDNP